MTESNISLRSVREDDKEFLCELYCSTRRDEVAAFGWDDAQIEALLRMQFTSRASAYKMQFPRAEHSVIFFAEKPAGSLIVNRTDEGISLTDIAVLPEYQKRGIATHFISLLKVEASSNNKPLVLRVDKTNSSAKKLYEKLGLVVTAETQILYEMEWRRQS